MDLGGGRVCVGRVPRVGGFAGAGEPGFGKIVAGENGAAVVVVGAGKFGRFGFLVVETEDGGEIAECFPAPIRDIGTFPDAGEFFEELEDGGVVEGLAADPPASGPRRHDDAGDAKAAADGEAVDELAGARLAGGTGGATWSKMPSFSS